MSVVEQLRAAPPRSWLFVPALRAADWLPKARASGADALIVDLEDATAPADKDRAREIVRSLRLAGTPGPATFVRLNAEPGRAEADLGAAVAGGAVGAVLPKVDDPRRVAAAARSGLALVPMIESARGLLRAAEIAATDERLVGLAFGSYDFLADIGAIHSAAGEELAYARAAVVVAAAAAGVGAVDAPWLDLADPSGAAAEAARARRLGFAGMFAIHPAQVGPINAAFTPSAAEVRHAREIVEAFDRAIAAGSGVAMHEGRMIDRPIALAARRVLARAAAARGSG